MLRHENFPQTPGADVAGVESQGLMQVVNDPRISVAQSLHAILVGEMTDNNGREMSIALAESQKHATLAANFKNALEREREHLQLVQGWLEEATARCSLATRSGRIGWIRKSFALNDLSAGMASRAVFCFGGAGEREVWASESPVDFVCRGSLRRPE